MLDPSTICARTAAGEAEFAVARQGLSVVQRRLLSLLDAPRALAELGGEHRLDANRLERDLVRLREIGLISLHGPSTMEPGRLDSFAPPVTVIIGSSDSRRHWPRRVAILGMIAALTATAWIASRPAAVMNAATPVAALPIAAATGNADIEPRAATPAAAAPLGDSPGPALATLLRASPPNPRLPGVGSTTPAPRVEIGQRLGARAEPPVNPVTTTSVTADGHHDLVTTAAPPASTTTVAPTPPPAVAVPGGSATPPVAAAGTAAAAAPAPTAAVTAASVMLANAVAPAAAARIAARPSLQPITREQPEFPRDAIAAGIDRGMVKARLTVDASGKVTTVDIIEAQPRRVFDRSVIRALTRWQFEPDTGMRTTDVEVAFSRN